MLILALLTLRIMFWHFVEWIASLLRLSDAVSWQNSQKNAPVWDRSDYAHFFRNLFRVERVTESEILAPSACAFNEHEILVSTEVAQEGRSNYLPIPILKCELVEQSTSLLCTRCSIVYRQVERSRDGCISYARGSFDGSWSIARGSFDGSVASDTMRNRAVACADCGIRVAHGADCGIGVAELVMEAVELRAAVVWMMLLKL